MTNQSDPPVNRSDKRAAVSWLSNAGHASGEPPRTEASPKHPGVTVKWYGSGLLLILLMLIAAALTLAMLTPESLMKVVARMFDRAPSATIAVAPAPASPTTILIASPSGSSSSSAANPIPPETAPRPAGGLPALPATSAASGLTNEIQLRAMLAEVTGRLGILEQHATELRQSDRLGVLEARLAALIDQPAITPAMLADALVETRQAAQLAAQEAARVAALDAARAVAQNTDQTTAARALQGVIQEELQKTQAMQKDLAPVIAELEKRMTALEKMAPAVVSIADIDKRVMGLEKMAPAVVAIGDLERRLAGVERNMVSAAALTDLDRRLTGLETSAAPLAAMSHNALQGESLALGLLNLRLALDRGLPYDHVLGDLRGAVANDVVLAAEVDRLAPTAARGVATLAGLRQRLLALPSVEAVAPAVTAPPSTPPETAVAERGFWAEIGQKLASIVTISRLDANASSSAAPDIPGRVGGMSAIDRAAAMLVSDELAAAVAAFDHDGLSRDPVNRQQVMLEDWLRDARARLAAENSFVVMSRRSLSLFSVRADRSLPAAVSPLRPAMDNPAPAIAPVVPGSAPSDSSLTGP